MIEILQTEDGSTTLYNKSLDETYHSKFGAVTESEYVFIKMGLKPLLPKKEYLNIFEVGFGTGLNAFLTFYEAGKSAINYLAVESTPLGQEIILKLNYPDQYEKEDASGVFQKLHNVQWDKNIPINDRFNLHKIHGKMEDVDLDENFFHLVYFDAFGPDVQPGLWTVEVFSKLYEAMKPGGALVSYTAKGQVRRNLKAAGFGVERLPGPPGKRHMTRATKSF